MAFGKLCYAVVLLGHMYYVVLSMIIGPGHTRRLLKFRIPRFSEIELVSATACGAACAITLPIAFYIGYDT